MTDEQATLVELDGRRRITLGKLAQADRYFARRMSNGAILLEPAVVLTQREAEVMRDPEFVAMLRRRVAASHEGQTVPVDWAMLDEAGSDANIGEQMAEEVGGVLSTAVADFKVAKERAAAHVKHGGDVIPPGTGVRGRAKASGR